MSTSLKSYCYELPRRVTLALIAPFLLVPIGFDLSPAEAQTSKPTADACTDDYPCGSKEGDCDSNTECYLGLVCAADVGSVGLGYKSDVDVCWIGPAGHYDSCTKDKQCWAGMGDCDEDSQCDSGLHCVYDVGQQFGWEKDVDVCMPHRWEKIPADKTPPTGAVPAGYEKGRALYICRAKHDGGTHIGKTVSGMCNHGFGDKERTANEYEVMVYTGANFKSQYAWIQPDYPTKVPARAVIGGRAGNNTPVYVCQATYKEVMHPGKLVGDKCHITHGGETIKRDAYEVLVLL